MADEWFKIIIVRGRYVWSCQCGRRARRGTGFIGLAQMHGRHHLAGKHKIK